MTRLLTIALFVFCGHLLPAQPISWLTDCSNKTFCFNQGSCTQGAVFMVEKAYTNCGSSNINYSYRIDLNNDGSQEIVSSADTVSGNFAAGTHKIIWRATDNCGNAIQCTYLFTIKDCMPPNLICINGLTQSLDPPLCEAHFNVDQFILTLTDQCTPVNLIERGIRKAGSGTGFPTEQDLSYGICDNGLNLVEVWVRDAGGLTNQCSNYVLIQSSDPVCGCNPDADLQFSGCARTIHNQRLSTYQPRLTVVSTAGVQPPISRLKVIATTDSCFSLSVGELPFGGDYRAVLRADRNDSPLNGVTTFDLVLMSKHILGIEPLTSAYQLEAADVNNSNSLTTFDIVETRKLILGIYDTFPQVPSWRLCRPLPDPSNLGSYTAIKDTYQILLSNLQADLQFSGYEFVGIKYGDLNNSGVALQSSPDARSAVVLNVADRWLQAGETATFDFQVESAVELEGLQMALSADPALLQIESLEGLSEDFYAIRGNEIRISWSDVLQRRFHAGARLFSITVKAVDATRLSAALQLDHSALSAEAYRQGNGQRSAIQLQYNPISSGGTVFLGAAPNPFVEQTDFQLVLPSETNAVLELFTLDGKLAYTAHYTLDAGTQFIRLRAGVLPAGKVFLYRLRAGDAFFSGKLVRG